MSKKVLIISQNFYPELGSAGNRIKNIYKLLKERDYSVQVMTTEPTYPNRKFYEDTRFWDDESLNKDPLQVTRITVRNKKYTSSIINRLLYYLEICFKMLMKVFLDRNKYDVVFVTSPPIFMAFAGLFAKYRYKSKLILDIRDLWPESLKGVGVFNYPLIIHFFSMLEKLLYRKSDQIVVNSQGFINFITGKYGILEGKIHFLPNSAKKEEIAGNLAGEGDFKVIYAGNIGLAQDVRVLMDLASKLREYKIDLTVMGYGFKTRAFKEYIRENKLTNVHFIKPATRKECLEVISSHHVGIVTLNDKSVFKTVLPGKIVDYMTCGIPIVASVSGYSKQVIEELGVGFVTENNSSDSMLKHILAFYGDSAKRAECSRKALNHVRHFFSWEKNIYILIDLIEQKQVFTSVDVSKESRGKVGT